MLAAASEAERALEKFRLGDDPCLRVRATLREFVESLLSSEFVLARPVNLWLLLLLLLLLQLLPPPPLLPKFARWSALGDAGDGDPSTNHPQPSSPPPSRRGESGAALAAAAEVSEPAALEPVPPPDSMRERLRERTNRLSVNTPPWDAWEAWEACEV
jgi:hypothetical protein